MLLPRLLGIVAMSSSNQVMKVAFSSVTGERSRAKATVRELPGARIDFSFGAKLACLRGDLLARPICLVQFEQRSSDNFAVRFRLRWAEIQCFNLLSTGCPSISEFGCMRRRFGQGEGVGRKKR